MREILGALVIIATMFVTVEYLGGVNTQRLNSLRQVHNLHFTPLPYNSNNFAANPHDARNVHSHYQSQITPVNEIGTKADYLGNILNAQNAEHTHMFFVALPFILLLLVVKSVFWRSAMWLQNPAYSKLALHWYDRSVANQQNKYAYECNSCRASVRARDKFCNNCGADIRAIVP